MRWHGRPTAGGPLRTPFLCISPQEAAFEAGRRLEAHIAATQRALGELQQLAEQLEAEGQQRDEAAARHRAALESNGGREARYVAQAAAVEAALRGAGFDPEASCRQATPCCLTTQRCCSVLLAMGWCLLRQPP